LRGRLAERARERVLHYTWSARAEKILAHIEQAGAAS